MLLSRFLYETFCTFHSWCCKFRYQDNRSVIRGMNCVLTHWGRDKMARHFADDVFQCIFLNENVWISIKISLKFVPQGSINNIPALVQMMPWHRPGNKPLSEPMMVSLLIHIYAYMHHLASMSWSPFSMKRNHHNHQAISGIPPDCVTSMCLFLYITTILCALLCEKEKKWIILCAFWNLNALKD